MVRDDFTQSEFIHKIYIKYNAHAAEVRMCEWESVNSVVRWF